MQWGYSRASSIYGKILYLQVSGNTPWEGFERDGGVKRQKMQIFDQ